MANNLVLSSHKQLIDFKGKNLLLADWPISGLELKNIKYEILDSHWKEKNKLEKDYKYLKNYYSVFMKKFYLFLNDYHKLQNDQKYWNIVVGPYLTYILPIVWDQWETIDKLIKEKKIDIVKTLDKNISDYHFDNMEDFINNMFNHNWRHLIFKEILKFKNINFTDVDSTSVKSDYKKSKNLFSIKSEIFKFFDKVFCIIKKNQKILFYQSYFGFLANLKLNLKFNNFPFTGYIFAQNIKINNNNKEKRKNLKIKQTKNLKEFEFFFEKLILKIIPKSYLENFDQLKECSKKISYNPKIIFTASAYVYNDFFKIWAAEKSKKKVKIIFSDHGFYLDNCINFGSEAHSASVFAKWGNYQNEKNIKMPPNIFLRKKKRINSFFQIKKDLLFLTNIEPIYSHRIQSMPISGETIESYNDWVKIYDYLDKDIKKYSLFRMPPNKKNKMYWPIQELIEKKLGTSKIDKNKNLYDSFVKANLVINTVPQTTFLETMYYDIPNLLFYKNNFINLDKDTEDLINEMRDKKILFDNSTHLSEHLNNIWKDTNGWWNSEEINSFKNRFNNLYINKSVDYFKRWQNFFSSELKKQ